MIYVSPKGSIELKLGEKNINYISLKSMSPISLYRVYREVNPDFIHAHDFKASIFSALTFNKATLISHIHHNPAWMEKINSKSLLYALTSFFIAR